MSAPVETRPGAVSPSVEDYLKAVLRLTETTGRDATTGDVATALGVSPPAVSKMLKRLEERGLVARTPYRGVELAALGRVVAVRIVRRHRLLERFLADVLGYPLDRVHDEAERLEHHISDEFERRIDAALGHPGRCPHGSPIPARLG